VADRISSLGTLDAMLPPYKDVRARGHPKQTDGIGVMEYWPIEPILQYSTPMLRYSIPAIRAGNYLLLSLSARHTRSGVNGRSMMRTPVARAKALATDGPVDNSPPSPIPLTPYGPGPSPFSTKTV